MSNDNYVVLHKNPASPHTQKGKRWAVDGWNQNWTELDAELHVKRCEYGGSVEYQIVKEGEAAEHLPDGFSKEKKTVAARKRVTLKESSDNEEKEVDTIQPTTDNKG